MTISTNDLKIFKAQRNRDTPDGGGAMSPNEVVDGELNNVFDDVSSEDRVTGRVSIRKVFPGVYSDDTERFYGAGLLIIEPAHDDAVDVLMARNTRYDDERRDVVGRIESFLVPGGTMLWRLYNNHLIGTASLTLYAPQSSPTPDLGDTLFLQDKDEVQPSEAVKIKRIASRTTQTFFDSQGPFQRDVMVLELSRPLQATWEGEAVARNTTMTPETIVRQSTVSAGARYYGVKRVEGDISQGDLQVSVGDPFGRLVPSTNAEEPVTDQSASLPGVSYRQCGETDSLVLNTSITPQSGETESLYMGGTILPGSVFTSGSVNATDNGDGTLAVTGTGVTARVDYDTGEIAFTNNGGGGLGGITVTATPAAAVQDSTLTVQVSVLEQTRALNYIRTLRPLPAPGTVSVDYRALNQWYRLQDDGAGGLAGQQAGEGGGTVDYATGTVTATLAALPDVGTSVIFSWGTPTVVADGTFDVDPARPNFALTIPHAPLVPGSLTLEYPSDGSTINLTSNAAGEILDGTDVVGVVTPHTGVVYLRPLPDRWPDSNAQITYGCEQDAREQESFQPTPAGTSDQVAFTLSNAPLEPGSVELQWLIEAEVNGRLRTVEMRAYDDGAGGLRYTNGLAIPGSSINYSTGEVSFGAALEVTP